MTVTLPHIYGAGHPFLRLPYTRVSWTGAIGSLAAVTLLAAPSPGLRHAIGFFYMATDDTNSNQIRVYWEDTGVSTTEAELITGGSHTGSPLRIDAWKNPIPAPITGAGDSQFILKGIKNSGTDNFYVALAYLLLEA